MKQFVIGAVLAAGLGVFVQAQAPAKPSISITADNIGKDSDGRAAFTGQVVLMIDETQITTDSGVFYNLATKEIELGEGRVRIKLSGAPRGLRAYTAAHEVLVIENSVDGGEQIGPGAQLVYVTART